MSAVMIDELGCIQLPKVVQDQLELTVATPLNLEVQDGKIILTPVKDRPKVHYEGNLLVVESEVVADNLNTIETVREERIQEQLSW